MSRSEPLSFNEIQINFNSALDAAITSGEHPKSDQGLDKSTKDAILEVALGYPQPDPVLIQNAQQAWRRQASGANIADQARDDANWLATRGYS